MNMHILSILVLQKENSVKHSQNGPFHYSHTWVIIQSKIDKEFDIKSFNIAYNCEFYYVKPINDSYYEIIEKYDFGNVHANFLYGVWSTSDGLKVSNLDFYARRMNTNGLSLRINKPWV